MSVAFLLGGCFGCFRDGCLFVARLSIALSIFCLVFIFSVSRVFLQVCFFNAVFPSHGHAEMMMASPICSMKFITLTNFDVPDIQEQGMKNALRPQYADGRQAYELGVSIQAGGFSRQLAQQPPNPSALHNTNAASLYHLQPMHGRKSCTCQQMMGMHSTRHNVYAFDKFCSEPFNFQRKTSMRQAAYGKKTLGER